MQKIISDALYIIDLENANGEIISIGLDATDIEQIDGVFGLMDYFDEQKASLEKRIKKLEKEYTERVLIRQTLRVTKEALQGINDRIDEIFGENTSYKLFLGSKSINVYTIFFDDLESHFPEIMGKAAASIDKLKGKYDVSTEKDDEIL